MKIFKYFLFLFLISFISVFNVKLAKWDDLNSSEQEKYKKFADNKNIKEVCAYTKTNNDDADGQVDSHYLFIYDDDTASVSWDYTGPFCERKSGNYCADGYKLDGENTVNYGVRNWSKNKSLTNNGVVSNVSSIDAYSAYSSSEKCPTYMSGHVNGSSHTFYLSTGSSSNDLSNTYSWAEKDKKLLEKNGKSFGNTNDKFYNFPISDAELSNMTEDLTCEYQYDDSTIFKVNISKTGNVTAEKTGQKLYDGGDEFDVDEVKVSAMMSSSSFLGMIEENKCPTVMYGCLHFQNIIDNNDRDIVITGDKSLENDDFCKGNKSLTFKCTGDNCSEKAICLLYDELRDELSDILAEYKAASGINDKTKVLNKYNKRKDVFNYFCKSTLANMDYADGTCVAQCIQGNHELAQLEMEAGMRKPLEEIKCNVGESILTMVYNVLKWAKYVAPAIVIILSILDFIRAMASQSDDEMKKVQGKFVKRLIIAALLFLLPLIINFLLKTFGMYSSKCDITDLFS